MIYISSSCIKGKQISDSIKILCKNGFNNIELSGGTSFNPNLEKELLTIQDKYSLNLQCHNYFPPPKRDFVLNLASLDDDIYNNTYENLLSSIDLSRALGSKRFAFHAGFFVHISTEEIGKKIQKKEIYDKEKSIKRFIEGYKRLQDYAKDVELYIENNVLSNSTYNAFGGNVLMLTSFEDYLSLKDSIDFKLLLDVAHLKVSAKSLNLDLNKQLHELMQVTDYFHLSDNDSMEDTNEPISYKSEFLKYITKCKKNIYTIEVYGSNIDLIKQSERIIYNSVKLD